MGYRHYQALDDAFYRAITDRKHPATAATIRTFLELPEAEDAPNPNLVRNKMTPAMLLAKQGNDDALQELVTARRTIENLVIITDAAYTNEEGVAALHLLARAPVSSFAERCMTIQRFAENKADVNVHSTKHPKTPLIEAAEAGIPGNVDAFLFYKADSTIKADGLTAKQSAQRMLDHLRKDKAPNADKLKAYTAIVGALDKAEKDWDKEHSPPVATQEAFMRAVEHYVSLIPTISDALSVPFFGRPKGPSR